MVAKAAIRTEGADSHFMYVNLPLKKPTFAALLPHKGAP
jgi:hypothetical protein